MQASSLSNPDRRRRGSGIGPFFPAIFQLQTIIDRPREACRDDHSSPSRLAAGIAKGAIPGLFFAASGLRNTIAAGAGSRVMDPAPDYEDIEGIETLIKTLLFSVILALASYALFQPKAAAATIELVPSSRVVLQITDGMTLDELVRRAYPDDEDLWARIKEKLIETNPDSFWPNSERLIAGRRLKLVRIQRIYAQQELVARTPVGFVAALTGKVSARDVGGREHLLQINSAIYEGDRLETHVDSSLQVSLDDGAEVFLKQDSVLKLSEYVITNGYGKESSSVLDLLRGGLRTITGAIGASSAANYQLQTGLATIGIRGTEYVVKLCKQDDCSATVSRNDPDSRLHAVVLEGSITLTTDDEVQILVAMGEYATATSTELTIEETASLPPGFLDADEAHKFEVTIPQQLEQASADEPSSNTWIWVAVGILLLAVGL
jgi:hypothetical protein